MKNSKLFKPFSALAFAGMMAISSVSLVSADETQVTDKPSFDMVFENEAGVKYLSEEDTIAVVEAVHGVPISEISGLSMAKYAKVHIVNDDTVFSIDWNNSTYGEEDVKCMYVDTYLWYKDDDGKFNYRKAYDGYFGNQSERPPIKYYNSCWNIDILENAKGEFNIQDNFCYSKDDFIADGGDEILVKNAIEGVSSPEDALAKLEGITGGALYYSTELCMYYVDALYAMNSSDSTKWNIPLEMWGVAVEYGRNLEPFFDNNMFLARVCIEYTDPETGETRTSWEYIASESALTNGNNPFTYLDEDPSDDTTTEEDKKDDTTTEIKEVTLTEDNKAISKDDMAALITENATKDVVIKTPAGITLTFAKGTMKAVGGKDTYDFGVSMSDDYSKHSDMGVVTKDNFVSLIDFNYSGNLPAEATVKIPIGADRAGQTLYYSQKVEAGYTLVQSVKVDNEGYITVKQDHCSTYVVTTTDVSKEPSTDVPAGVSETGGSSHVVMCAILCMIAGALLIVTAGSKIRKRA